MTSALRLGSRRARMPPIRRRTSGLLPCIFQLPAISLVRMIPPLGVNEGRRFYCVRAGRTKRPMKTARTKPAQGVSERRNLPQPAVQKAHFPSLLSRPEAIGPHLVPASRTAAMITKSGQLVAVIGRTAASEDLGDGVAR